MNGTDNRPASAGFFMPAEQAVAEARSYKGVPWRHRGRSRRGIDCIGLVVLALAAGGFMMRDRTNYGREPWRDGLQREMREHFGEPVSDWQPGDVALMRWDNTPEPSHVALIGAHPLGGLSLIHSYSHATGGVCENGIDAVWQKRIVEVYRPWQR